MSHGTGPLASGVLYDAKGNEISSSHPLATTQPRQNYDAFGRFRTATPANLFDSKQLFDNQPQYWDDQQTEGAGTSSTFSADTASSTLAVSNLTAGTRVRQTFRRFNYQSGKSQLILQSGILGAPATGITRRIGLYDANNGLFFQSAPTGISIVRRSHVTGAPVDAAVLQADWSLDKLDGTGPSGVTLDPAKVQLFIIDFGWLGVGFIRFGFVIGGQILYVHSLDTANNLTTVWASNPNLPLRCEIANDGTGGIASLVQICASVISEGGSVDPGATRAITRGTTPMVTGNDNNLYPLISMRLRSGFASADVRTTKVSITCSSNGIYNWFLILNPTVVGTALSFTPVPNSVVEVDAVNTNATTLTAGTGTTLAAGVSQQTNEGGLFIVDPGDLQLGANIAAVSDILVLAVQRLTVTPETFFAALAWKETI